jgi:hypothetical protein
VFNRYAIKPVLVKTPKENKDSSATMEERIGTASGELVTEIAKDVLKRTAITVGVIIVAIKVVDILGEIAVKKTKSADNK